jgi:hypothetical protein
LLLAVVVTGAFTATVAAVSGVLPDTPMTIALIRTLTLALLAILLALLSRLTGSGEAMTIARVVLAVGGLKLLAEDMRVGRAAMLVVAFVAYGCAMLLVARSTHGRATRSAAAQ